MLGLLLVVTLKLEKLYSYTYKMYPQHVLLAVVVASFALPAATFRIPGPELRRFPAMSATMPLPMPPRTSHEILRGGGPTMTQTGALALPACWGLATTACSLAFIRQAYVFSLSYGLSMAMIGAYILSAIPTGAPAVLTYHAWLVIAYGVRLFGFLLWRQIGQDSGWAQRLAALDKTPRSKRAPLVISTSLFYALMASPLLFHLQSGSGALGMPFSIVSMIGCAAAAFGLLLEAVADHTKSLFKIQLRKSGAADRPPTGGVWAFSRHANYLGEIIFWVGATVAGLPSLLVPDLALLTRFLRALSMGLGLSGIVFIMISATNRLEQKQAERAPSTWPVLKKDGTFDSYQDYVARSGKLLPKVF